MNRQYYRDYYWNRWPWITMHCMISSLALKVLTCWCLVTRVKGRTNQLYKRMPVEIDHRKMKDSYYTAYSMFEKSSNQSKVKEVTITMKYMTRVQYFLLKHGGSVADMNNYITDITTQEKHGYLTRRKTYSNSDAVSH